MKHTVTLHTYAKTIAEVGSQHWGMLNGRSPAALFADWGFTIWELMARENGYDKFMVYKDGAWFYAHANGSSAYVSISECWVGRKTTPLLAWTQRKNDQAVSSLLDAAKKYEDAVTTIVQIRGEIAAIA